MENKEKRDSFIQMTRALCMICVVIIHTGSCEPYLNMSFPYSLNVPYFIIMRCIVNCCVGTFVFLAGYFVPKQINGVWVRKRLGRILIPYFFWTLFYIGIQFSLDVVNHNQVILTDNGIDVLALLNMLFLGRAAAPLYYCIVMAELIILTPLLLKVKSNELRNIILCITPTAYVVGFLMKMNGISIANMDILPTSWMSYYYFGLLLAHKPQVRVIIMKFRPLLVVIAFFVELIESWALFRMGYPIGYVCTQMKIGGFLYTTAIICLIVQHQKKGCRNKSLIYLGDRSFAIFFLHIFGLTLYFKVLELIRITIDYLPVHNVLGSTFAICISLILSELIRRLVGGKNARTFFGI